MTERSGRLHVGDVFPERALTTATGEVISVPQAYGLVHLQLRRFAGCPVCNLHLRSLVRRREELAAASIQEVVVFHSSAEDLRTHVEDVPFSLIPDPEKRIYTELGAELGARSIFDPRAWGTIMHGIARSSLAVLDGMPSPPLSPEGGRFGLPAEFLIASDGRILALKYGEHADDQWSVDALLALAMAPVLDGWRGCETSPRGR